MASREYKLMIGINDLLEEIKRTNAKIFKSKDAVFLSTIKHGNSKHLQLIIPMEFWNTSNGQNIQKDLEENRSVMSNLLTGNNGNTGIKAVRAKLVNDLISSKGSWYNDSKKKFEQWFDPKIISEEFSINCLPTVSRCLARNISGIKKDNGASYNSHAEFQYDIDIFQKTLQSLCATKRYPEFFWWLFLYALLQSEITCFLDELPKIQYNELMKYLTEGKKEELLFSETQMICIEESKFWDIRRKLISTAHGHMIIAGPSLKDAFSVDDPHTIIEALKSNIENKRLNKVSILITDPIIFESTANCGDPVRNICGTIETLQERFYNLFEKKGIELHIYFLPLLQIDHAVITEEFMAFRSNKLWNRERKYKGAFGLYLANFYTPNLVEGSEYLAHKEYLNTIMENSTIIYPSMDVDSSLLDKTTVKSKHMHWRQLLKEKNYRNIFLHKVYEKQIFSYVCDTWSGDAEPIGQIIPNNKILHYEDLFDAKNLINDETQNILLPYLRQTQQLFEEAIKKHDRNPKSCCRIFPSLDLGVPNNVYRIAGGFATGMLVTWQCGIDIVPIDATVNVCTSSVFRLNNFDVGLLSNEKKLINELGKCFGEASTEKGYSFSFTSGNHFLIIARDKDADEYYLVMHSSANELKNSYMGLYPIEDNWYYNRIKEISGKDGRYFRYLKDEEARHFIKMAHNFRNYNEQIHKWLAQRINGREILDDEMLIKHHYYMPTDNSIALGTFVEAIGEKVPIFSAPGKNIYIFEIGEGNWQVNLGGNKGNVCLVPHGWGQRIEGIRNIKVDKSKVTFFLNNRQESIPISSKHHIDLAEKSLRNFKNGEEFLFIGKNMIQGTVVKELIPCFEYSNRLKERGLIK